MNSAIPRSYQDVTSVAIKGIGADSDMVICTTDKKLATFFRGYLVKSCFVEIVVERLVPFVEYGPKIGVYYILYGDNRVVIVKDGTNSLEIIKTYVNIYEMTVSDYTNSGIPQLYMKTDKGFECVDISENTEQISNQNNREFQETSVLYQFCINKLQKLQLLYDTEKNKISERAMCLVNAITQVSNNNEMCDVNLSSNVVANNSWLKLSKENLVYGFTLQNTTKLPISDFNVILLENNKHIWSRYRFECWTIERNKNSFMFHSSYEHSCPSNTIAKCDSNLNPGSSIIVACVIDNWSSKSLPYYINGIVYINNENYDRIQYINTEEIMVSASVFLDKEFTTFIKNGVFVEDLVTLECTKLSSRYQIKCTMCLNDLKTIMVDNFKFDTKNEWLVNSSLLRLRTIVCHLDSISPFEYILKVFTESSVDANMFTQILYTMLPENAVINSLDNDNPTHFSIDAVMSDLKTLRMVFKECLNEQTITIPRHRWNSVRSSLLSAIV